MSIRWLLTFWTILLMVVHQHETDASGDLHKPKNVWYVEDGKEYKCMLGRQGSRDQPKEINSDDGVPTYSRWG
ncbi:hypothetical protein QR680_010550 [Steinernema hermaphroditum]|uniref:Uncharacterized protein n=1 Tax=Steinernema hermaphroditum TaxID=289476 RepID=A0AA39IS26_9BILA|nr:hypothetical protein QR680_010550 [Steinernema hermaphroditum]